MTSLASSVNIVLVTNVGQGFGRAVALAYGAADFDVVCADRDVDLASKTAAEIEELGGQAIPIQADMSVQLDVQNAFDKVFEIFGDLSGVVHVASAESPTPFRELSEGEFVELLDETLRSAFLVLKTTARFVDQAWVVLVAPSVTNHEPHMAAVRGSLSHLAAGFAARDDALRVNVVVPSRSAADPSHDAPLVKAVQYLSLDGSGLSGQTVHVKLPPPPRFSESLLPEVRAALDETMNQEALEASLYDDPGFLAMAERSDVSGRRLEPFKEPDDKASPDNYDDYGEGDVFTPHRGSR
jgi:NAD(P)-dependent dehydrogenase (short-subunit alcohol dehydrogenase family)